MLREMALREYLRKSPRNFAVLTDYAAMEAYKTNSLDELRRSYAILSEFPKQVLILKGTQTLCGLSARGVGLQRRLIDEDQTRGFGDFCKTLRERTDLQLRDQFDDLVQSATWQMDRMLADAKTTGDAIALMQKSYTESELRVLRRNEPYTSAMIKKMMVHVTELARKLLVNHPKARSLLKGTEDIRNVFIFRVALCGYSLTLRWIAVGGAEGVGAAKLRNDMVDINFAACATYFDGLLSADQKLLSIYYEARVLLHELFVPLVGRRR
jgi:hypothetical protein